MPGWEYRTVYLSGALDFPEIVDRPERLTWAGKALTQQINEQTAQGWEVLDLHWLTDVELMVTFKRPVSSSRTRSERQKSD